MEAEKHANAFLEDVLLPLKPDVFLSSDMPLRCAFETMGDDDREESKMDLRVFVARIEDYIKGSVLTNATEAQIKSCFRDTKLSSSVAIPEIPDLQFLLESTGGPRNGGSGPQWRRLKYAWDLMGSYEKAHGFKYDVVVKMRFDGIPGPWKLSSVCHDVEEKAFHAMSDYAFWGRRNTFATAVGVNEAMTDWFNRKRKAPNSRPFAVKALLQTFLSAHPWTFAGFPKSPFLFFRIEIEIVLM